MRGRLGRRTAAAGVAGGLLLAGLAGCTSDGSVQVEATAAFLAESAERTTEADTGRFTAAATQTFDAPQGEVVVDTQLSGEYDAPADRLAGEAVLTTSGDVPEEYPTDPSGSAEVVQDALTIFYLGFPFTGDGSVFGGDERWVSLELPEEVFDAVAAGAPDSTNSGYLPSPAEQLEVLEGQLSDVEEGGSEEVRGVPTTLLTATYRLPDAALDELEELTGLSSSDFDEPQQVEVWVDGEGIVRRLSTEADVLGVRTEQTTEYFDLGTEVDIEVPEDATPVEELAAELSSSADGEDADAGATGEETFAETFEALPDPGSDLPGYGEGDEHFDMLVDRLAELSPQQLAEDPCQAFADDPDLQAECEEHLG